MIIYEFVALIFVEPDFLGVCEEIIEDFSSAHVAVFIREALSEAYCPLLVVEELDWIVFAALDPELIISDFNIEGRELSIIDPLLNLREGKSVSSSIISQPSSKYWRVSVINEENIVISSTQSTESS